MLPSPRTGPNRLTQPPPALPTFVATVMVQTNAAVRSPIGIENDEQAHSGRRQLSNLDPLRWISSREEKRGVS
jgi:hypothetical protein